MILGRVVGTVVATRKDERLEGFKLLVVQDIYDPTSFHTREGAPVQLAYFNPKPREIASS